MSAKVRGCWICGMAAPAYAPPSNWESTDVADSPELAAGRHTRHAYCKIPAWTSGNRFRTHIFIAHGFTSDEGAIEFHDVAQSPAKIIRLSGANVCFCDFHSASYGFTAPEQSRSKWVCLSRAESGAMGGGRANDV